jgi:hypothetical protein
MPKRGKKRRARITLDSADLKMLLVDNQITLALICPLCNCPQYLNEDQLHGIQQVECRLPGCGFAIQADLSDLLDLVTWH